MVFGRAAVTLADDESGMTWGVSAMTLKPAYSHKPSSGELLTNDANTISLNRFYRAGGTGPAPQPTDCRVSYDADTLFVIFHCAESDMSFPATNRDADWYSLLDVPPDQDPSFPDKVDLFIRPNPRQALYYQFAVTLDGSKFGCEHSLHPPAHGQSNDDDDLPERLSKVTAFKASVSRGSDEWTVVLRIPWRTIGGKPRDYFGLLPIRTRWRDGEVASPVAFDFTERPPMDLFIETHFSGSPGVHVYDSSLCRLPSGLERWQKPALLSYPDIRTVHAVWQMEQSLSQPTDKYNFGRRVFLVQRWTDLMALEGFDFRIGRGSLVPRNMDLYSIRRKVNGDLQYGGSSNAYQSLDAYLHQLDSVSRRWFADGSPGDIGSWEPVSRINSFETNHNVLVLNCSADGHPVNLHLSLPETGGVRLYAGKQGFFKPDKLLPLNLSESADSCSVTAPDGKLNIRQAPFEISMCDAAGNPVIQIGPNDLAFRFGTNGQIAAVDFRNNLQSNDVIYGFGEQYDHFNENGHVLTLWGMDDWNGNTVGLMNETYKPIALFHDSRGYTIFDDSTYRLRADAGATDPREYRLTQFGPIFDYYIWTGPAGRAIESYTDLTGKPILPPKWAFGPWMGRTGRGWLAVSHNAVAEEERVTERFAQLDIPHSAIYSEGPGQDSAALNQFMAARDIKVLSWFWPVVSESGQAKLLPGVPRDELPILNCGNPKTTEELGYVDFTNPNALPLMRAWWEHRLDIGVAGSMVDFGDRVPESAVFYDGRRGDQMHNFYAYDYHRTIREVFQEKRGKDFILFGRAAAPGDQRWVAQFAGDHPANFPGLQSVLTGALNLCACGFSIWGSDLGGFLGWPEPGVYMRWDEFACFSPLMRCHGRTPREPWNYGDAAVANYKRLAWVRENLLNYIYNAAADSHESGVPIMRSMAFAWPHDAAAAHADAQYMFGPDLLVAPVITDDNMKTIIFPPGQWTSLWTGASVPGPTRLTADVPLNAIPVYLRPGAIVPVYLNPDLQFGQSMTAGSVKALIVTPPEKSESAKFEFDAPPLNAPVIRTPGFSVNLQPETNGFAITLGDLEAYLLLYGMNTVSSVTVNGRVLPEVAGTEVSSMPAGWQRDPGKARVIVRLPVERATKRIQIIVTFHSTAS